MTKYQNISSTVQHQFLFKEPASNLKAKSKVTGKQIQIHTLNNDATNTRKANFP